MRWGIIWGEQQPGQSQLKMSPPGLAGWLAEWLTRASGSVTPARCQAQMGDVTRWLLSLLSSTSMNIFQMLGWPFCQGWRRGVKSGAIVVRQCLISPCWWHGGLGTGGARGRERERVDVCVCVWFCVLPVCAIFSDINDGCGRRREDETRCVFVCVLIHMCTRQLM